jgi:hypothetical protein
MWATKLFHKKQLYHNGIIEMVIWRLPNLDSERPHGLKYRLVYVKNGKRLVGYDNERGKGDHKHIGKREQVYTFQGVDQLLEDFWNDVKRCNDD